MFIVRAGRVFNALFSIGKAWMDEGTRNKVTRAPAPPRVDCRAECVRACVARSLQIFVLGSDYMETITKYVSADHVPKYLGGNCACEGDPECRSK